MNRFADTPIIESWEKAIAGEGWTAVPADWFVVLTDISGSTKAINAGRYKAINSVAAASILAALNTGPKDDIGYQFGGDGATLLVPPSRVTAVNQALLATRQMAKETFGFDMRVCSVPVHVLLAENHPVFCTRLKTAEGVLQTLFDGTGFQRAEDYLKERTESCFVLKNSPAGEADFTGLECRWLPMDSRRGQIVSLICHANGTALEKSQTYLEILRQLRLWGASLSAFSADQLKLSARPTAYSTESRIRSKSRFLYQLKAYAFTVFFDLAWKLTIHPFAKRYRQEITERTDFLKYDGILRMTLDMSIESIIKLNRYLDLAHQQGKLFYGLHRSPQAMITCLIFDRQNGQHFHFVDGSDGGFVRASIQLKSQLKAPMGASPHFFGKSSG